MGRADISPVEQKAIVLDSAGRELSPTPAERAWKLVATGEAELVSEAPLTIRLHKEVEVPEREEPPPPGQGRRLLMHTCCGPCATYCTFRLRSEGFDLTSFWFNPNIHPYAEHEKRRETLHQFAQAVDLAVVEEPSYELVSYFRAVVGHEAFRERCRLCYRLRLERTAQVARQGGYDCFTTTLLISPYQDEEALKEIGEEVGRAAGVDFYYEHLRRGWGERGRLAKEYGLYKQSYCGCVYSEWERHGTTRILTRRGTRRRMARIKGP